MYSSNIYIKNDKYSDAVYQLDKDSKGLALFILFDSSKEDNTESKRICKQIQETFSQFSLESEFIYNTEMGDSPKLFLETIEKKLALAESQSYSCLICFLIGNVAPLVNDKLSYILKRDADSNTTLVSMEEIHSMIYTKLSKLPNTVPAIIFNTCISQDIPRSTLDSHFCPNTFLCYASNNVTTLPQGVHPHQLVQSLYEVLNDSKDRSLLLMELFSDVRDNYFSRFPENVKNTFNKETTFYSKNTIRTPTQINDVGMSSQFLSSVHHLTGLLFFVFTIGVLKGKRAMVSRLMSRVKNAFRSMKYKIGENVVLTDNRYYNKILARNSTLGQNCKLIFIIVLTKVSSYQEIIFDDGTKFKEDRLLVELSNAFPTSPQVVLLSQLVDPHESGSISCVQPYEHMLVVNSIESKFSDASLIKNFGLEVSRNYLFELHTILSKSVTDSQKPSSIQIVDGLKNNFYFNYDCYLAQQINAENIEFEEYFERAFGERSVPFKFYRLMVVGPEGVGKTSLLRALTGQLFQPDEKATKFLDKYDLQVQKMSHDWSQIEDFRTYINNIKETRQYLAMKAAARMEFEHKIPSISYSEMESIDRTLISTSLIKPINSEGSLDFQGSTSEELQNPKSPSKPNDSEVMHEWPSGRMNKEPLDRIQSLSSRSDFLTAWDFPGQNYLYCFHSIFLSPRSVYIIPIDLTIKDLNANIEKRKRNDRHDLRSNSGVPRTYMEVYEFWLGAIYSVCKTLQITGHYNTSKIIFVFTKADKVPNAKETARTHFEALKLHLSRAINAFSLVHDGDELFLLSCKTGTKYFEEIAKLKAAVKRVSDQVAFERPIPIKWLKLANEILKEKLPILDRCRIQFLVEKSDCSKDIKYFLQFFHEIGFFFCKQDTIIIDIQCFLNLLYHILFPSSVIQRENISIEQFELYEKNYEVGKISLHIFEKILDLLQIRVLGESVLELLQLFGILVRCQSKEILSDTFYIPYLLTGSLYDIKQKIPSHTLIASFFVYFPDGFLPASIYFALLSECIRRNEKEEQPHSSLGFDCAVFNVSEALLVEFDYFTDRTKIIIKFYSINSLSSASDEEKIISELLENLVFVQLSIVQIQTTLIPCGTLAKIMFLCDSCDTLSMLNKGLKPICSLETLLTSDVSEIELLIKEWKSSQFPLTKSTGFTSRKRFCCKKQFDQFCEYIQIMDSSRPHYQKSYSTDLSEFIFNNRQNFIKHINWKEISKSLFTFGLISANRYSIIIDKDTSMRDLTEELLMEFVHKGPLWAIKFYLALRTSQKDHGNRTLVEIIEKHMNTVPSKVEARPVSSGHLQNSSLIYNMNRARHGIAFIVNIEYFEENILYKKRDGSRHDIIALKNVFDLINYETKIFENLTRKEFLKVLKSIRSIDHSKYDSFFCVIMSHGNDKGEIIFANNKPLSKSKIESEFSPRYCKGLESKPRIFIFQACRGKEEAAVKLGMEGDLKKGLCSDSDIDVSFPNPVQESFVPISTEIGADVNIQLEGDVCQSDQLLSNIVEDNRAFNTNNAINPEQESSSVPISAEIDTFVGDSTVNQYVSYRNESKGTFFIQSFCSVMESCSNTEFTHIMMEVRRKISLISNAHRQCTEDTNRLQAQVYF